MNPPNPLTFADDPHLDRHGEIVHPIQCDACHGTGNAEYCPRHPGAACPCSTLAVPCEECTDGIVDLEGCECSGCVQIWEDLERRRIRAKRLADAAPDLLVACQLALDELDDVYDASEDMPEAPFSGAGRVITTLKEAIRKAVG